MFGVFELSKDRQKEKNGSFPIQSNSATEHLSISHSMIEIIRVVTEHKFVSHDESQPISHFAVIGLA